MSAPKEKIDISSLESFVCKNCETAYKGFYCPNCGQSKKEYEKPFGFLIVDLMGDMLAFDSRLWKTLKSVLFKPGHMAKEYIEGKRVKYMPPFRFYVFVSFVFFLLVSIKSVQDNKSEMKQTLKNHTAVDSLQQISDSVLAEQVFIDDTARVKLGTGSFINISTDNETDQSKLDAIQNNPEVFINKFFKYLSWILFILMPVYGLLLWMFFRKAYRYYIGHLIFSINQHAFAFIILALITAFTLIFPEHENNYVSYLAVLIPIYILVGTKKLYGQKWLQTWFKLNAVAFVYLVFVAAAFAASTFLAFI